MKTQKHGNGMTHKQIITFRNRLQHASKLDLSKHGIIKSEFIDGWQYACKYFAHKLYKELRFIEKLNEI